MDEPVTVDSIALEGFRAYLDRRELCLASRQGARSLAVFAPNATGKSALIDGFEFFFSATGTLQRLGDRRADTRAGPPALAHNLAGERGVRSVVDISFRFGPKVSSGSRTVGLDQPERPEVAERILEVTRTPFVVRGYELRGFVEDTTAERQYEEFTRWFGLDELLRVQRETREIRLTIERDAEGTATRDAIVKQLKAETDGVVDQWDEDAIANWFGDTLLNSLDPLFAITEWRRGSETHKELTRRKDDEDHRLGIATLVEISEQITQFLGAGFKAEADRDELPPGALKRFQKSASQLHVAVENETKLRTASEKAVFKQVWDAAKNLLAGGDPPIIVCPVCTTPLSQTVLGSADAVLQHLVTELDGLSALADAERIAEEQRAACKEWHGEVVDDLGRLDSLLTASELADPLEKVKEYRQSLGQWVLDQPPPDSGAVVRSLGRLREGLDRQAEEIRSRQGTATYGRALSAYEGVADLKAKLLHAEAYQRELARIHEALVVIDAFVNREIRDYMNALLGDLSADIAGMYGAIRGPEAPTPRPRLELPGEGDINQRRLLLRMDFASNRTSVAPSGYMSDSEVHALALSLRLAAIRQLNGPVRVVILDDVVTSYDAEHRRNIAALLAELSDDSQFILVTHDERFYNFLKDLCPQQSWIFKQILDFDAEAGPDFADHKVADEVIEDKLKRRERAANDIRQAEEEWLRGICLGFGVSIRMRGVSDAYRYGGSEMAQALATFLKSRNLVPPLTAGVVNRLISTLQRGEIENFGSHFTDDPYASRSGGDEKARWNEFKQFRALFRCPACCRTRFVRSDTQHYPRCKHRSCETPFRFVEPNPSEDEDGEE